MLDSYLFHDDATREVAVDVDHVHARSEVRQVEVELVARSAVEGYLLSGHVVHACFDGASVAHEELIVAGDMKNTQSLCYSMGQRLCVYDFRRWLELAGEVEADFGEVGLGHLQHVVAVGQEHVAAFAVGGHELMLAAAELR